MDMEDKMTGLDNRYLWKIQREKEKTVAVNVKGEKIELPETFGQYHHGDVIAVEDSGKVRRMHDGSSTSALVYVTNQCNSNCIMCPDSVKQRTRENTVEWNWLTEYISLLPSDLMHIDITGGEPTLLKAQLPELIERIRIQTSEAEILMLSNGRSFAAKSYAEKFSIFSNRKFKIEIPVHSDIPELHDQIAGFRGSFEQTRIGIHNLLSAGVEVGIRIVVSRLNYQKLQDLIRYLKKEFPQINYVNIMGMEMLGNAWKNREAVWVEFEDAKEYLQQAVRDSFSYGLEPSLYNFPLCLFDKKFWYCYRRSISDYKIVYDTECEKCKEKGQCGGFFASTFHYTKYKVRVQE